MARWGMGGGSRRTGADFPFAERTRERSEGALTLPIKSILDGWGYDAGYSLKEHSPGHTGKLELKTARFCTPPLIWVA